jgi:hypothetical protein
VTLSSAPVLLMAGPADGTLARWGARLAEALAPGLPADARIQATAVGGADGVTGANQFTARVAPDGNTLLLAPGAAALAWQVGDRRAQFDVGRWLGVMAGVVPGVVCGRVGAAQIGAAQTGGGQIGGRPGERLRVGMAGPVGPDLAALLGLELAGLAVAPVFGVLDQDAAAQALASRAVDAVLLRGAGVAANLAPLAQVGVVPLFALGDARDPAWLAIPTLAEFAGARGVAPGAGLSAAWHGVAATAQTEFALVLPQLTPAALVALWRQAGSQAMAAMQQPGQLRALDGAAVQALAADAAALSALRAWLAERLNWKAE